MKYSKIHFLYLTSVSFLFLLMICLPGIAMKIAPRQDISETEKRKLAPLPVIQWTAPDIISLPSRFEDYIKDHFGFRNLLIHKHSQFQYRWLKKSPNPQVAMGKDSWLFYQTDTFGISLSDDFRGLQKLSEIQLEAMQRHFETKRDWLAEKGIQYLYVAVPNKHSIYPEFFPDHFTIVSENTQLDQFLKYMKLHSNLKILDLRPVLLQAKHEGIVYFRTDSHWNDRGAYIAYRSIIDRIKKILPEINSGMPEPEFTITKTTHIEKDLAKLIGLPELAEHDVPAYRLKAGSSLRNDNPAWTLKNWPWWTQPFETINKKANVRAIIFRDSFIDAMLPFFAEHFRKAAYIASKFDYSIMEHLIREIQPDIVIEQGIERHTFLAFLPEAIYATMGNDLLIRGENEPAIEKFQKALELKPDDPDSHCNLGFALLKARRFDEAIAFFKQALELDPNHIKTNQNLRLAFDIIRKSDIEITKIKKSLASDPNNLSLLNQLGRAYLKRGKTETALSFFDKILAVDDTNTDALNNIAVIYAQKKEYEKAILLLKKIIKFTPEKAGTYYNLACMYSIRNEIDQSIASLRTAIEKGYDNFSHMKSDSDLKNARKHKHFDNLIPEYQKKP